jgi:membrane peptidoglycan carboxypeptidase
LWQQETVTRPATIRQQTATRWTVASNHGARTFSHRRTGGLGDWREAELGWRAPEDATADDVPGNTQPLPEREPTWLGGLAEPQVPQPKWRKPRSRKRRYLKRATITVATLVALFVLAAGTLLLATPSASEATRLAAQEAAQHGITYPGPPVPANFSRPLVATEDHRFYSEPGIDVLAVGRVIQGKLTGRPDQGGATIEQQLAKMLYTPGQSGWTTELKQIALAFKLNYTYSKAEILRLYAEVAYYGHGYYGLEAASCGYFGHPVQDLTVVQGAMLAGVVNAPSIDDPINDPVNARARLTHVIDRMVAVGYLTSAQGAKVLATPLSIVPRNQAGC